jgi:hypothetical protein
MRHTLEPNNILVVYSNIVTDNMPPVEWHECLDIVIDQDTCLQTFGVAADFRYTARKTYNSWGRMRHSPLHAGHKSNPQSWNTVHASRSQGGLYCSGSARLQHRMVCTVRNHFMTIETMSGLLKNCRAYLACWMKRAAGDDKERNVSEMCPHSSFIAIMRFLIANVSSPVNLACSVKGAYLGNK